MREYRWVGSDHHGAASAYRRKRAAARGGAPSRALAAALIALILALLAAALAPPLPVAANAAPPWRPGDLVGEPTGAVAQVAIVRETLAIDLRPLAERRAAIVEAAYALRNDGPATRAELVFVAAALAGHWSVCCSEDDPGGSGAPPDPPRVTLDASEVPSATRPLGARPAAWEEPKTTPGLAGDPADLFYQAGTVPGAAGPTQTLAFAVDLGPGPHTLRVRYAARPSYQAGLAPARTWQLGYVLAPARQWATFGGLDVTVALPAGWDAASRPALGRDGDTLRGAFAGLPADALAVTTRAPGPLEVHPGPLAWLAGLLAVAGAAVAMGRALDRRRGGLRWEAILPPAATLAAVASVVGAAAGVRLAPRPILLDLNWFAWIGGLGVAAGLGRLAGLWLAGRGRSAAWALLLAPLGAVAWPVAVVNAFYLSLPTAYVPAGQANWQYCYRCALGLVYLLPPAVIAGLAAAPVAAALGHRWARGASSTPAALHMGGPPGQRDASPDSSRR